MKRFSQHLINGFLFSLLIVPVAMGQTYMSENGKAEFTSSVPLHTFTGTSNNLTGQIKLDDNMVDFYLDLTTLETGNSKRDKDMRKTLNTDEHPFAEFLGTLSTPLDPAASGPQPVTVTGAFKINGVSKNVEIIGTITSTSAGLQIDAAWDLNLEDYDIVPPKLLIVKVDEIQKIRIMTTLTPVNS